MNNVLEDRLSVLAEDEIAIQAIEAVLNRAVEKHKPQVNQDASDQLIGQEYRAYSSAKDMIKQAIIDIKTLGGATAKSNKVNKGK